MSGEQIFNTRQIDDPCANVFEGENLRAALSPLQVVGTHGRPGDTP